MPPVNRSSRRPSNDDGPASRPKISDRLEELHLLAQQLSMTTGEVERWIRAMNNLSSAFTDQKKLADLISYLSDWQKKSESKGSKSTGTGHSRKKAEASAPHHPISRDGDSLYDIINAPNFTQIVEKVMAKKKRSGKK
ncbi:MAG: hypothetical protein ACOYEF_01260 [Planifilum sp.]